MIVDWVTLCKLGTFQRIDKLQNKPRYLFPHRRKDYITIPGIIASQRHIKPDVNKNVTNDLTISRITFQRKIVTLICLRIDIFVKIPIFAYWNNTWRFYDAFSTHPCPSSYATFHLQKSLNFMIYRPGTVK